MIVRVIRRAAVRTGGWIREHRFILLPLTIAVVAYGSLAIAAVQDKAGRTDVPPIGGNEAAIAVASQFGKELCQEAAAFITNCTPIVFGAQDITESDGTETYVALAMTGLLNGKPANQPLMVVIRDGRVVYVAS